MQIDEQILKAKQALKDLQKKKKDMTNKNNLKLASLLKASLENSEFKAEFIKLAEKYKFEKILEIVR